MTPPEEVMAIAKTFPAAIAVTPVALPVTWTGVLRWVVVLSPSWPLAFVPQESTVPSDLRAREKLMPAAMAVTPVALETWTGVVRWVVVPSPSWPKSFAPHARTVPSDLRAREWELPTAIAVTPEPLPRPVTSVAESWEFVVPLPIWPLLLTPHARTVPSDFNANVCELDASTAIAVMSVRFEYAASACRVGGAMGPIPKLETMARRRLQTTKTDHDFRQSASNAASAARTFSFRLFTRVSTVL